MKIVYLRLKGYAGIYHGMERDEIAIDFTKFKNKIILIQGDNGCGKSTIINTLSPDIDSSDDYRSDMLYNEQTYESVMIEYPAEKELHLLDGDDLYRLLIISPVTPEGKRKTTKAFISLNGEELNPNGNVTSFKDIRDSVLEIDSNYLKLSYASSEKRGLVDMTPGERKKFMSSVVSSLESYNNYFRILSKKSSLFKTNINNLKSKIYNIGYPEDIIATLSMSKTRLFDLDNQKEAINQKNAESKATIKILDPDNKIQDLYTSILEQLEDINSHISKYNARLEELTRKFNKSYQNDISIERKNLEYSINEIRSRILVSRNEVSNKMQLMNTSNSKQSSIENQLSSLLSSDIRDDIESIVIDIKDQLYLYKTVIQVTDMNLDITRSELLTAKGVLDSILKMIASIRDNNDEYIQIAIDYYNSGKRINVEKREYVNLIQQNTSMIDEWKTDLNRIDNSLNKLSILDNRPSDCSISSCIFIKDALDVYDNLNDINEEKGSLEYNIITSEKAIKNAEDKILLLDNVTDIYDTIVSLVNFVSMNSLLLNKLGKISQYLNKDLLQKIYDHHQFNEFLYIDDYIGMIDIIEKYREQKNILIGYEADLKIHNNNKVRKLSLETELIELKQELFELDEDISKINNNIKFDSNVLVSLESDSLIMDSIIEITNILNEYKEKKRKLGEDFNKVRDDIASVKIHVDIFKTQEQAMQLLEQEYIPLKESIDRMNFKLLQLESYQKDLMQISDQYEKVDFVKKACNPSSDGIQKIYISMYMTTTIIVANELLSYLFNGGLRLLQPIVDDGFSIPFINEFGQQISDISKGSSSQRSMFGMCLGFALLSQASDRYNILRMDEVDGGLDTGNRMGFMPVVFNIMDIMNVEQSFLCSHNIETETERAGIIYVSKNGLDFRYN